MDGAAAKLLQELGRVNTSAAKQPEPQPTEKKSGILPHHDDRLDRWRMLLVEMAYILNASFRDVHYWERVKTEKNTFRQFVRITGELDQKSVHDQKIRINYRGNRSGNISQRIDYVITFDDVMVDIPTINGLTKRVGLKLKHLEGRLQKSFECFADKGISSLIVKIPGSSDQSLELMRISLRVLSCYHQAVDDNEPIEFVKEGKKISLLPILNEMNQPDPNFTLVAALNDLSMETMAELIRKVGAILQNRKAAIPGDQSLNLYHAMFSMKGLSQMLLKPPIEVNGDYAQARGPSRQARFDDGTGLHADPAGGRTHPAELSALTPGSSQPIDSGIFKARVARFVKQAFGKTPNTASRIMKSVYGQDYKEIDPRGLGERFKLITDLLFAIQNNPTGQQIMKEVLRRIQGAMDRVPIEVLDDLVVQDDEVKLWSGHGETVVGRVDERLLNIIKNSKQRTASDKKARTALSPDTVFETQDYEDIAKDFGISVQETKEIIKAFKSCFDNQGNFLRAAFENKVPEFARHEKKVFDILWEFLKEMPRRNDRLPFLNSLQVLVKEIKNPIQAIKVLLSDFNLDTAGIKYSDRNAIMLVNQFLRTYNKEINIDIEITPEEVLYVKEGLDKGVVNYVKWKIDGEQEKFFEKSVTIRKKLLEALSPEGSDAQLLPIRFLLALEREIHIFLSLVGGSTAYTVIRGALMVYGNPDSQVYQLKESQNHRAALLQHMAVLIHGFSRLGEKKDSALLEQIKEQWEGFRDSAKEERHDALLKHLLRSIDIATYDINARHN